MSRLSDLIRQAKAADSQLGADLEREFRALTKRRSFGLVFERHQPEAVELAGRPVRKGDVLVRWGGEEFVAILNNTDAEGARIVVQRLREAGFGSRPDGSPLPPSPDW